MHRKKRLSPTHEMYLKVLYNVRERNEVARVRDIAQGLGVLPGTVTSALKKLEKMRFVDHDRYGIVALTPAGQGVAECVLRRFDVLRSLLVEVLGVDPEVAAVDACMMEHAVSPATINRMDALLQSARSGRVRVPQRLATDDDTAGCSQCEVLGSCQAVTLAVG